MIRPQFAIKAYTWLLGHEAPICRKVVRAIAVYYKWRRQKEPAWFDDYDCHAVKTGDDLRDLMAEARGKRPTRRR